jgi:hypothetical protein
LIAREQCCESCDIARPDFPEIVAGRSSAYPVGDRRSRYGIEGYYNSSGNGIEGPGESGWPARAACVKSGIRALKSCLYISGERREGERGSTLIHTTCIRVVSEARVSLLSEEETEIHHAAEKGEAVT